MAGALGLAALELRAHKLLVYGPGQFFKPHQDTEKHPGMVGTLSLVWPSAHIGGILRVQHGDAQELFASQHLRAQTLRWCAFYADCRHEVLPVAEGWRVVLTFDLVVPATAAQPGTPAHPALLAALRDQCYPQGQPSTRPWVFLLDHEYSQRGLRWELLKGDDRPRVLALRAAAQALGLQMYLALAEIHENWTASYSAPRGRYRDAYDDGDPEPDELIDEDMTLDYWVDADGQVVQRKNLSIRPTQTESFTDTGEEFLVNQEHEGYMGNYGDTLDYWYRRAALVLQTPEAHEASRFVTEFDAALADALRLARSGAGAALAQRLAGAWELLLRSVSQGRWNAYAELACALPDGEQARALCEKFDWTQMQSADVAAMARLAQRWGDDWLRALVQAWLQVLQDRNNRWRWTNQPTLAPWPQPLPAFIQACQEAALAPALVQQMLQACVAMLAPWDEPEPARSPAQRMSGRTPRIAQITDLAMALQRFPDKGGLLQKLILHVRALPALYPLLELPALALALRPLWAALPQAQQLHADVLTALQEALAEPPLADDDHSYLGVQWACRCADCTRAIDWALAPTAAPLTLAMAEARRSHVEESLQRSTGQFRFETLKKGSPYQLVIRKSEDLPLRRRQLRERWEGDLAALA
ncbi:MAG: 2OG-Fe(II) oxygenase [Proteobacteria bacterium]|nr:2OG-Fe(II) oxygenase [Pseudomonadota bacterium]MBS0493631.1 2OG-Fe(II) oxygenase [Pseudomonadota bacterium]